MSTRRTSASHKAWLQEQLKDPGFTAEYLTAAAEDAEPRVYLAALKKVAEARGGLAEVARRAKLPRESVSRALSPKGNPRWSTLSAILRALGLKVSLTRNRAA